MIGGIIWPPVDAVASTPPANVGRKPRFLIIGIVMTPVPTTLATAEPDTVPKIDDAMMAACAGPPRNRRMAWKLNLIIEDPPPVPSSTAPMMMNGKTVFTRIARMLPMTPSPVLYQSSAGVSWTKSMPA